MSSPQNMLIISGVGLSFVILSVFLNTETERGALIQEEQQKIDADWIFTPQKEAIEPLKNFDYKYDDIQLTNIFSDISVGHQEILELCPNCDVSFSKKEHELQEYEAILQQNQKDLGFATFTRDYKRYLADIRTLFEKVKKGKIVIMEAEDQIVKYELDKGYVASNLTLWDRLKSRQEVLELDYAEISKPNELYVQRIHQENLLGRTISGGTVPFNVELKSLQDEWEAALYRIQQVQVQINDFNTQITSVEYRIEQKKREYDRDIKFVQMMLDIVDKDIQVVQADLNVIDNQHSEEYNMKQKQLQYITKQIAFLQDIIDNIQQLLTDLTPPYSNSKAIEIASFTPLQRETLEKQRKELQHDLGNHMNEMIELRKQECALKNQLTSDDLNVRLNELKIKKAKLEFDLKNTIGSELYEELAQLKLKLSYSQTQLYTLQNEKNNIYERIKIFLYNELKKYELDVQTNQRTINDLVYETRILKQSLLDKKEKFGAYVRELHKQKVEICLLQREIVHQTHFRGINVRGGL